MSAILDQLDGFYTIESYTETKLKEKGSIFISQAYPVADTATANDVLEKIRKTFFDATHHCYAYTVLDNLIKYSDAGEPSGTAGIRIYNAIEHFKLQNVLVVVIRYFGGTKLGVGPLGKAYYESAYQTLSECMILKKTVYKKALLKFDFTQTGRVHHTLSNFDIKILKNEYSDTAILHLLVKAVQLHDFTDIIDQNFINGVTLELTEEYQYL